MINYFIFNDINSIDENIIIRTMPPIKKAAKRIEKVDIPGKNGSLYIDEDAYETMIIQIECSIIEKTDISRISKWLNGRGNLILSSSPDRFYKANIINSIDFTSIVGKIYEFPLEVELDPISYGLEERNINISEETEITITESTYNVKPYIKVVGSGDITLTINDENVILNNIEDYIELDCEIEEAYKEHSTCNHKIYCNEFPKLHPGENHISWIGNVQNLQIKYREAFI